LKTCTKCGALKPEGEFHINRASPSGRASYCKICKNNYERSPYGHRKEYRKKQREELGDAYIKRQCVLSPLMPTATHIKYVTQEMIDEKRVSIVLKRAIKTGEVVITDKRCTKCKETKPLKNFHINRHVVYDGHTSICKECTRVIGLKVNRFKIDNLTDSYIRKTLSMQKAYKKLNLKPADISANSVELMRAKILEERNRVKDEKGLKKKSCKKCFVEKRLSEYPRVGKSNKTPHKDTCRECQNREYRKIWHKYQRKNLTDRHVLQALIKGTNLKREDIPPSLITLKRSEMAARRALFLGLRLRYKTKSNR